MASIVDDPNGRRRIMFIGADDKRRTIRLGNLDRKSAESVGRHVEALLSSKIGGQPITRDTSNWLPTIGDTLRDKLAAVGLIEARESHSLRAFLDNYIAGRASDGATKGATLVTINRVANDLVTVLGADAKLRSITVRDAEKFKPFYQDESLADATIYRRLKMAKLLFNYAMKFIDENPFADVEGKNSNPVERRHYITESDTLKLIGLASPTWRTIIALARFAGLRCPSEALSLNWENIDFATGRMTVSSPKNEHLEGREYRLVPIFGRLRQYLEDAFELAAPGEVYVVGGPQGNAYRATSNGPNGWVNTNLRTTFEKLIRRAGLQTWPRMFHNLRASCETDLMQDHPIHVVTAWIGNTPKIALGHYLQTLEGDFEKALKSGAKSGAIGAQNPAQTGADTKRQERTNSDEVLELQASRPLLSASVLLCNNVQMAKVGLEPTHLSALDFESSASAIPPLGQDYLKIDRDRSLSKASGGDVTESTALSAFLADHRHGFTRS